jgi:hypothetical protein
MAILYPVNIISKQLARKVSIGLVAKFFLIPAKLMAFARQVARRLESD